MISRLENVELHILPRTASAYLWQITPFDLIVLGPPGQLKVSVVEQFSKSIFVEDEHEVTVHEEAFARLLSACLSRSASQALIERVASWHER